MKLTDLENTHTGNRVYIIGKGPSLDRLEEIRDELATGVVMCLNESIHKFETLGLDVPAYCVQQDSNLEFDCVPKNPKTIHVMSSWQHAPEDRKGNWIREKKHFQVSPYNPNAVLYRPDFFKESECTLSAVIALKLAKFMGINEVSFCCFDALIGGFNGSMLYANCIGKQKEGSHRSHNKVILGAAYELMKSVKTLLPTVAEFHR